MIGSQVFLAVTVVLLIIISYWYFYKKPCHGHSRFIVGRLSTTPSKTDDVVKALNSLVQNSNIVSWVGNIQSNLNSLHTKVSAVIKPPGPNTGPETSLSWVRVLIPSSADNSNPFTSCSLTDPTTHILGGKGNGTVSTIAPTYNQIAQECKDDTQKLIYSNLYSDIISKVAAMINIIKTK